jgi:predicted heme/steroid binding protein
MQQQRQVGLYQKLASFEAKVGLLGYIAFELLYYEVAPSGHWPDCLHSRVSKAVGIEKALVGRLS